MSDENKSIEMNEQLVAAREAASVIENTMEKFLEAASVEHVYSEPVKYGDTVVIPAAEVISAAGFGIGLGSGSGGEEEEGDGGSGAGGGGGGGGRVFARPVAVVIASPDGVRVEPVADRTKILLAAITTFGFMFSVLARIKKNDRS
jgi:uncharacterized spore protein YtfJ